jgi:hypothetical protein
MLAPLTALGADGVQDYPPCVEQPSAANREAAEGAFKAGSGSYNEADYPKAILYWRDAYDRDCTAHLLLMNLANAFERMGDRKAAVHALRIYLERVPDAPNRAQLEKRIENLDKQIAAEKQAPVLAPTESAPVEPQQATLEPQQAKLEPQQDAGSAKGGKSIAPWIVVGAGGAVTLVGALVYLGGSSKVSDAEKVCTSGRKCPPTDKGRAAQEDGDDGRQQMDIGGVLAGVGLAGIAGGLVWHFVFDKPSDAKSASRSTTLQPDVSPGYAGVTFGGSF